jgi:hypothetical protein
VDVLVRLEGNLWNTYLAPLPAAVTSLAIVAEGDGRIFVSDIRPREINGRWVWMWNGSEWEQIGDFGSPEPGLHGVGTAAWFRNRLYVGGSFTNVGGQAMPQYLIRWENGRWVPVDPQPTSQVSGLQVWQDQLLVSGPSLGLLVWDGTSLRTLSPELGDRGWQSIAIGDDGRLAVANQATIRIQRSDGWQTIYNQPAGARFGSPFLQWNGADLFVGGVLFGPAGTPQATVALWHEPEVDLRPTRTPEGGLRFRPTGSLPLRYQIEASSGLTTWTTNSVSPSPFESSPEFVVPADGAAQFYRLREVE